MPHRRAKKLLIVGWDAADWIMIDALFAQGRMPNLKRLVDAGARSDLATLEPKLSPILWSSIATGKTADKHGILNFVEANPAGDGLRVSSSTTRRTKALWNILSQSGMGVHTVSWYASHPAEAINGICVTNLFQDGAPEAGRAPWPVLAGSVHPDQLAGAFAPDRIAASGVSRKDLAEFIPSLGLVSAKDSRPAMLAKQLARLRTVHAAGLRAVRAPMPCDCALVFYETIDTVGHHFMEFLPPKMSHVSKDEARLYGEVIPRVYDAHDAALGELLSAAGPDTTVLLLSDHGFHSGGERPVTRHLNELDRAAAEASWHRPLGVLVLSGPGVARGAQIHSPTLLDITPTALALLGLPVGADMDGRVLAEALDGGWDRDEIPSWDERDGPSGMHEATASQNPFESADALKQLIDLGYMPALAGNVEASLALARRESQANLAVVYMTTNRPQLALPILRTLLHDNPDESRFAINLGNCLMATRAHDECVGELRPFFERHTECVEVGIQLAASLAQTGARDEAARLADDLEGTHLGRANLALAWADLRGMLGQWDRAVARYTRAKEQDPADPRPLVGLARAALHAREWDAAVEHCLDACEIRHSTPEAHDFLGVALAWLGDAPHAIQSFEIALSMQPGLIDAHRFVATLAARAGDHAKAKTHADAAASLRARATIPEPPPESWGPAAFTAATPSTA